MPKSWKFVKKKDMLFEKAFGRDHYWHYHPEVIERAEDFIIDRRRPRQHLSFGFGIHRCVGNRLAELQLKTLWEEALKRWPEPGQIQVMAEPERATTYAIRNYKSMPVRINA